MRSSIIAHRLACRPRGRRGHGTRRGSVAAPRQRRGPSRRTGREGRPPRRHHRRLRLQVRRRTHDARPERGRAHDARRTARSAAFRTNSLYELKVDRNQDGKADIAYRVRFSPRDHQRRRQQDPGLRRPTGRPAPRPPATCGAARSSPTGRTTPYKHAVSTAHVKGGGSAFAGARDDPFFFDLPGFIEFKKQLLERFDEPRHAARRLHGDRHVRRDQRPLDRDPAARTPSSAAPVTPSACSRTTSVPSNGGWKQIDRMGRPAINTVFNGLILPGDVGLQRPGEGRLQLPAPEQRPLDHDRQRHDRAQRDRQRADHERRDGVHGGRGLGDRAASCCPTS